MRVRALTAAIIMINLRRNSCDLLKKKVSNYAHFRQFVVVSCGSWQTRSLQNHNQRDNLRYQAYVHVKI